MGGHRCTQKVNREDTGLSSVQTCHWNPGLLTVTENTVAKDGEGLTRPHPWLRSHSLALDACWGKEGHFSSVWPVLRQMTPPPCTCKQHQVDSGLEGKEDEEQGGGQMKLGRRREHPRELEEGIGYGQNPL